MSVSRQPLPLASVIQVRLVAICLSSSLDCGYYEIINVFSSISKRCMDIHDSDEHVEFVLVRSARAGEGTQAQHDR